MIIYLKEINKEEFLTYYEIRCEHKNILYSGNSTAPDKDKLANWVERVNKEKLKLIYLVKYEDDYVGYLHIDFKGSTAEIGYGVREVYTNKGIGTEIIRKCIETVFGSFSSINIIEGWVAEFNKGSEKCFLKNGFQKGKETKLSYYEGFGKEFVMYRYFIKREEVKEL